MKAKIEVYNDFGDLVDKYVAPPYEKYIDYEGDYEIRKYYFRFMYAECVPKCRKDGEKWVNLAEELIPIMDEEEGKDNV